MSLVSLIQDLVASGNMSEFTDAPAAYIARNCPELKPHLSILLGEGNLHETGTVMHIKFTLPPPPPPSDKLPLQGVEVTLTPSADFFTTDLNGGFYQLQDSSWLAIINGTPIFVLHLHYVNRINKNDQLVIKIQAGKQDKPSDNNYYNLDGAKVELDMDLGEFILLFKGKPFDTKLQDDSGYYQGENRIWLAFNDRRW
ncbi:MAG: hypothetical protein HGA19_10145 [Oscillochloris sp.]|nr:hypothetical protein [Oscillochloris sp.]